jgi:hypothetical protein
MSIKSFTCSPERVADVRRYTCDSCLNCRWFKPSNWINYEFERVYNCYISFYINKTRYAITCYIMEPWKRSCVYWREQKRED